MTFLNIRRLTLITAAATAVAVSACSADSSGPPPFTGQAATASAPGAPLGAGSAASGPHNRADVMFAMMMIPHHAQALQMSDLLLGKTGIDPQVTALARQIKDAQAPEIAQMRGWLASWGQPAPPTDATMPPLDHGGSNHGHTGMMSQAELTQLQNATGADAQRLFLVGMTAHHEGAITMARDVLDEGSNAEVLALARSIVSSQQAEIATMRQLLGR